MEVIYLYNEELDTLQELTEVTNSKLIEIASEVSKELTERVNEAWDKLPNFEGDPTTKCEEVDELFAQNSSEIEPVAKTAIEDCISRQQAIEAAANGIWHFPNECYQDLNDYGVALALATDSLAGLPPVTPTEQQDKEKEHDGKSICHTCATNNCPFQSGIYRNNCDFYTSDYKGGDTE